MPYRVLLLLIFFIWAMTFGIARAVISQAPIISQSSAAPNLVLTIDDSYSMLLECLGLSCAAKNIRLGTMPRAPTVVTSTFSTTPALPDAVYSADPTVDRWAFATITYAYYSALARRARSPDVNRLYYDPRRVYRPWMKADGSYYPNSPPTAAPYDPTGAISNATLDLTRTDAYTGLFCTGLTAAGNCEGEIRTETFARAQYHLLTPFSNQYDWTRYTKVEISGNPGPFIKYPARSDCAGSSCTQAEELQNFANWFTYYRSILHTAKAALSQSLSAIPPEVRLGYGKLSIGKVGKGRNPSPNIIDGEQTGTLMRGVRPFTGTDRNDFYSWLFGIDPAFNGGGYGLSSLRGSLIQVGNYYMRNDNAGPWAEVPGGNSTTPHVVCRRALHVTITDGAWGSVPGELDGVKTGPGDQSKATYSLQDVDVDFPYGPPYRDGVPNTLADVAMYYWKTNLRSDIATGNSLAVPALEAAWHDGATYPHMVNYTIAIASGATATAGSASGNYLNNPASVPALKAGTLSWPRPTTTAGVLYGPLEDLWHAAWNSGGMAFNALNPQGLSDAIATIIDAMKQTPGFDAPVLVPSRLGLSTYTYMASYQTKVWAGDLQAFTFDSSKGDRAKDTYGNYLTAAWAAAPKILNAFSADASARKVYTINSTPTNTNNGLSFNRINFTYNDLNSQNMIPLLTSPGGVNRVPVSQANELINYLRGENTLEYQANNGSATGRYRNRPMGSLGDIVNSNPVLVRDGEDMSYDFLPSTSSGAGSSYRQFLLDKKKRVGQVFVGANDGMLHAFNANNGDETFAFVPKAVLGSLYKLGDLNYLHQYYVDGPIVEADVYGTLLGDSVDKWRNIVVATGGAGANNIFAINVPVKPNGTGSSTTVYAPTKDDVLWEVSSTDPGFSNLGAVIQKPAIGLLRDGSWAVIVGNGYVNANGVAKLYVINALTGALIKSIDIPSASGNTDPNGLGGVRLVLDSQRQIVKAYAGDLQGNLWKFDFSSNTPSSWGLAFAGQALYTAKDANGKRQPITATPAYQVHPKGGNMVVFGTGKIYETSDAANTDPQSLYGVWDTELTESTSSLASNAIGSTSTGNNINGSGSLLVQQTVTRVSGTDYYQGSSNNVDYATKRGWYVALPSSPPGLRLVYPAQVAIGRIFLQAITPTTSTANVCVPSKGQSLDFVLNPFTGTASLTEPTFDTNGDNKITATDKVINGNVVNVIGKLSTDTDAATFSQKISATPISMGAISSATGQINVSGARNYLRRTWRQIITRPF